MDHPPTDSLTVAAAGESIVLSGGPAALFHEQLADARWSIATTRRAAGTIVRSFRPRAGANVGGRRRPGVRRRARANAPPGDSDGEPEPALGRPVPTGTDRLRAAR